MLYTKEKKDNSNKANAYSYVIYLHRIPINEPPTIKKKSKKCLKPNILYVFQIF